MAFMTAIISEKTDRFMIVDSLYTENNIQFYQGLLEDGDYTEDDLESFSSADDREDTQNELRTTLERYPEFSIVTAFYGQLTAPGYMDQTDLSIGETKQEVAQQLLDLYFSDRDPSYMDDDEKGDLFWLERIASGRSPAEATEEYLSWIECNKDKDGS